MTVTREELLRAAYASPDDTDRLVLADWLEQNGEVARAQVIHLQCERAKLGLCDRRRVEIEWELAAVMQDVRVTDEMAIDGVTCIALERGLPSAVRVRDLATLVEHADAIHAAAPAVHTVELAATDGKTTVPPIPWIRTFRLAASTQIVSRNRSMLSLGRELELAAGPNDGFEWIERTTPLERLAIYDNDAIGNDLVHRLVPAEWAREMSCLEIPRCADKNRAYHVAPESIDSAGAFYLRKLEKLERLVVDHHNLGDNGLHEVMTGLPKLRALSARQVDAEKVPTTIAGTPIVELDLSQNEIGAQVQVLAKSPRLATLASLTLESCEIMAVGVEALVRAPFWQTLRFLDLSQNPIGKSGARALAEAARPAQLHTLRLADADLDEAAGSLLGKTAWLGELLSLDLSGNMLGRGAGALRALSGEHLRELRLAAIGLERAEAAALARFWPRVVHLDASNNPITDAGVERFATKEAPALQTLCLHDCKLGNDGLELLAERGRCPRLRLLDLSGNAFGATALEAFVRAPIAQALVELDLSRCALDGDVVAMLARTPMPERLRRLQLRGNELTEAQLLALAESHTLMRVARIDLDGNPFVFDAGVRERLAARFGAEWYRE